MKKGFHISTKLIVTVSSLISIGLVVFIAITANYYITRMSENNSELYKAYQVSEMLKAYRSNMITIDGSHKRYMLTGNPLNLEKYQLKETETKTLLKSMEHYFDGRPQEAGFDRLRDLSYRKFAEAKELKPAGELAGMGAGSEESAKTLEDINQALDGINAGLSETTQVLIYNSTGYLELSKKWNLLEIALGVAVALAGIIILFRDINLRNRLEAELRKAKKQAEENATAKEQFMANMSHEIRTPMNAILGFSDLLQKTRLDKTQEDYLDAIRSSGNNLLNIINDILDFSKIEAGKLSIEKIDFPLHEHLLALQTMFGEKARGKGIHFSVSIDKRVPARIFGDPTRLSQVLTNLIGNAIKFTAHGSVKLSCELKSIEHDVAQLVFRITDTGIGIPADQVEGIFERFNQGHKETTRVFGGTGLGLSIVKSLVEIQNGTIYVKSREGAGSEFVVTLSYPVSYENRNGQEIQALHRLPNIGSGSLKVLLVEDNALNQKLALNYLQGFGLKAELAVNGQEALDLLAAQHFDLVLMDIQMPVLDGYNAAKKIREELKLSLPVIAMTAHVIDGEREKCLQFGMSDYISKPFREAELHSVLNRHLQNSAAQKPAQAAPGHSLLGGMQGSMVDFTELSALSRGNKAFITEMIGIFMEQNPADLQEVEAAIAKPDFEALRAIAHRMKTSMGFMGLKTLMEPVNRMELLAEKQQDAAEIKKIYGQLKHGCDIAMEELRTALYTLEKN